MQRATNWLLEEAESALPTLPPTPYPTPNPIPTPNSNPTSTPSPNPNPNPNPNPYPNPNQADGTEFWPTSHAACAGDPSLPFGMPTCPPLGAAAAP